MKSTVISSLRFLSVFLVFTVLFILPSVVIPVSPALLKETNPEEMELFFPLFLLFALYISGSYWLWVRNTNTNKRKVFLYLASAGFILFPLMTWIESVFWLEDLQVMDMGEINRVFLRGSITYLLFSGYVSVFAKNNDNEKGENEARTDYKTLMSKLVVIGVVFLIIYNFFGYFVAWQFESTRLYYTGSTELKGFLSMLAGNFSDPKFVVVHFLRGMLFGLSGYFLYAVLRCSKIKKLIVISLIFGAFGFQIIMPNPVFPEMVRISHFIETTTSMLLFGLIASYIFSLRKRSAQAKVIS